MRVLLAVLSITFAPVHVYCAAAAQLAGRPLALVITGAPGSGKDESSKRLSRDYGVVHISAGALLREYALTDPQIQATMKRGELVPVDLVVGLVGSRMTQPDALRRGFVLDGFPRRVVEAEHLRTELSQRGIGLDAIIVLDVPEHELRRRIAGRGRADDTETVFRGRLEIYRRETLAAIERLEDLAPVLRPKVGEGDIEANYQRVKAALDVLFNGERRPS